MSGEFFANPNQQKKPPIPGQPEQELNMAAGVYPPPQEFNKAGGAPPVTGSPTGIPHLPNPTGAPPVTGSKTGIPHLPNPTQPTAAPTPAAPNPSDPFAAMGGGVKLPGGEWVPANHPLAAGQPGARPDATTNAGNAPPAPGAAPAAAPAAPGAVPGAPGATPPPAGPPTTVADAFKKTLMDAMNKGPVSMNDPELKAQSEAFGVGQTRASEMQRAQSAERLASQGLGSSGAADSDYSGITERQGEKQAGFNAGLVGDAAKARRQEIMQAAAMAGNQLNAEDARGLQKELAQLDAQIRREGITQQGALGQADIGLRGRLGEGQLNLGMLQSLLQNQQFGRGLDQQGAIAGQGMDTQTLLGLLGGL